MDSSSRFNPWQSTVILAIFVILNNLSAIFPKTNRLTFLLKNGFWKLSETSSKILWELANTNRKRDIFLSW
jgi:hypothetical protein